VSAQPQWRYAWIRCPTCQTKAHRKVRVPGSTWRRCNVCGAGMVVTVTIGPAFTQTTVAPSR